VARGWGKPCVAGCGDISINYRDKTLSNGSVTLKEGDWISINGSTGEVINGKEELVAAELSGDFATFMEWVDEFRDMKVRTNADTPADAKKAREFGAEGIGLCRTEHMFFEGDRILAMREMIVAANETERRKALAKLLPFQKDDFRGIFRVMDGLPVTIRLLDPPLHEFLPHDEKGQQEMAKSLGLPLETVQAKVQSLHEFNPMLGHRGCRLGLVYPEIYRMQVRAIFLAIFELLGEGLSVDQLQPEIMIPLVGHREEMDRMKNLVDKTAAELFTARQQEISYLVGTMIELPRACLVAGQLAEAAAFFSFGTNDLTQTTLGYSRDDSEGKFLPFYLQQRILKVNPFAEIDREGVGSLVKMGIEKGRASRPNLKVGICGEHGGDPSSIEFFNQIGLDYVSCSPYRLPIARLAAARATLTG
jgi:pyruvate, orthophosphate dikinase